LFYDQVYIDETAHFDRERIPERVVHAKGSGMILSFYTDMADFKTFLFVLSCNFQYHNITKFVNY